MIAIIDYGVGNLKSIRNMFKKVGIEAVITDDINEIVSADKYVLPGVGSFDYGISNLRKSAFLSALEEQVLIHKKPILGICLGMQLLTNGSEEGTEKGLGWIDAKTLKFDLEDKKLVVPHMGWNTVKRQKEHKLFEHLIENRFYFVHSYYVKCTNKENSLAIANYGCDFTCSIEKDNILGVQFHPEKSHKYGMQLLKNFGEL